MPQLSIFNVVDGQVLDQRCTACDLSDNVNLKSNCMSGIGPKQAQLMFVGKAPGNEDDGIGKPMTGANGRLFTELLREAGINLDTVYITNCVKCATYNKELKTKHFTACKNHLLQEIRSVQPKAIVAVGAEALEWLTGETGIKKLRRHGLPCTLDQHLLVFPIGQPAQLFHSQGSAKQRLRAEMIDDLLWLRKRMEEGMLTRQDEQETDYKTAKNVEEVLAFLAEIAATPETSWVTWDLETSNKEYSKGQLFPTNEGWVTSIGFSLRPGHGRAIPLYAKGTVSLYYWKEKELAVILPAVAAALKKRRNVWHNGTQFDQKWVSWTFPEWENEQLDIAFDTIYAHYLIDPSHKEYHRLESLARLNTKMSPWKSLYNAQDTEKQCYYLCRDVDAGNRIIEPLWKQLTEKQHWLLQTLVIPLGHELCKMEQHGVKVDSEGLDNLDKLLGEKIEEHKRAVKTFDQIKGFNLTENKEFNPDSNRDLALAMEYYFKFPKLESTGSNAYSTNARVLEAYSYEPFIQHVLALRRLGKLHGTYCKGIKERLRDGIIHTQYNIPGTVNGRLSSEDPNLQNLPTPRTAGRVLADPNSVKQLFRARDGYVLIEEDQSQIELRVLAYKSGDPELLKAYREDKDIHRSTAARVYSIPEEQVNAFQRDLAKPVNFGIIYGKTLESIGEDFILAFTLAWKAATQFHGWSLDQVKAAALNGAREFWNGHKMAYPLVWQYMDLQEKIITQQGYQETNFGRRRYYEYIDAAAIREAYNFPIQSEASEYTLFGIVNTAKALRSLGLAAYPLLTVHDSIVFECRIDHFWQVVDVTKSILESQKYPWLTVPLKVDIKVGYNWGRMKKVNALKRTIG